MFIPAHHPNGDEELSITWPLDLDGGITGEELFEDLLGGEATGGTPQARAKTTPPGVDGRLATEVFPKPSLPVSVQIGGVMAELLYAGAAPGLVAGVLQVNVRVPSGIVPGPSVSVQLNVGGVPSRPGVTLAVR